MVHAPSALFLSAVALSMPSITHAHGYMSAPMPVFKDIYNKQAPGGSVTGTPGPYTGNDEIKGLAEKAGSKCGNTNPDGPVQAIPADNTVAFTITAEHIGPCEVWLDNNKVVSAKECWKEFPDKRIKIDFSKCASSGCLLRWIWMATHTSPWEFFDNCVRVGGSGGGGSPPNTGDSPKSNVSVTPSSSPPGGTTIEPSSPSFEPGKARPSPEILAPSSGEKCFKGKDSSLDAWCVTNCAQGFCPPSHCQPCK